MERVNVLECIKENKTQCNNTLHCQL